MTMNTRLLVVALIVSVVAALPSLFDTDRALTPDSSRYLELASSMFRHGSYSNLDGSPHSFSPPGYPAFVAVAAIASQPFGAPVTDRDHLRADTTNRTAIRAVLVLQVVLLPIAALLLFRLSLLLGLSVTMANAASYLFVLSPLGWTYSARVLSEALFTVLLLAGLVSLLAAQRKHGRPWSPSGRAFLAGLFLGIAVLTRVILLPCVSILPLFSIASRPWRRTLLVASFGVLVAIAPWMARNHVVFERFGLCSTFGTNALHYAAGLVASTEQQEEELQGIRGPSPLGNPFDESGAMARASWNLVCDDPLRFCSQSLTTSLALWAPPIQDLRQHLGLETGTRGALAVLRSDGVYAAIQTVLSPVKRIESQSTSSTSARHSAAELVQARHPFSDAGLRVLLAGASLLDIVHSLFGILGLGLLAFTMLFPRLRSSSRKLLREGRPTATSMSLLALLFALLILAPVGAYHPRFRVPLLPVLSIGATLGAYWLWLGFSFVRRIPAFQKIDRARALTTAITLHSPDVRSWHDSGHDAAAGAVTALHGQSRARPSRR